MKNKSIYIVRLIALIFITLFLFNTLINMKDIISKIVISPFLICSITMLCQSICLIINKEKHVKIFQKVYVISFLLYIFGFLILWCYINVRDGNYLLAVLSLPFWMTAVYIFNKYLLNKKTIKHKYIFKYKFKGIINTILICVCLLLGIIMIYFGISETHKLNKLSEWYNTTNGYFNSYKIYDSNEKDFYRMVT